MGDGAGKTAYELGLDDLTDTWFGTLRVLRFYRQPKNSETEWICLCECGKIFAAAADALRKGATEYCPECSHMTSNEWSRDQEMPRTKEYRAWLAISERTTNPKCDAFSNYGGRGISVCERWKRSFRAFYEDMGPAPTKGHSIDRIDNDGNYEPGNCRWADRKTQNRNRRSNVVISHGGESRCIAEWAEIAGISEPVLRARLSLGWDPGMAMSTPVRKLKRRKKRK